LGEVVAIDGGVGEVAGFSSADSRKLLVFVSSTLKLFCVVIVEGALLLLLLKLG
jgi:hypothetical protein